MTKPLRAAPSICASRRRGKRSTMSRSRTRNGRAKATARHAATNSSRPTWSRALLLRTIAGRNFSG